MHEPHMSHNLVLFGQAHFTQARFAEHQLAQLRASFLTPSPPIPPIFRITGRVGTG